MVTLPKTRDERGAAARILLCSTAGWVPLALVLFGGAIVYFIAATRSGLWYDEAIEYYYSRCAVGPVPGGLGTQSMYERIVSTYQPPLYNVLMFLWLRLFDSEIGFRSAGILITLLGASGMALAVEGLLGGGALRRPWGAAGAALYLLNPAVAYYALECGEYNLMLCTLCWALRFWVRARAGATGGGSLLGFYALSCLAVCSQYGAVFTVVPMAVALFLSAAARGDRRSAGLVASGAAASVAAVGVPLLAFFLLPQMAGQGSAAVSHAPVFARGNPIVDFVVGGGSSVLSLFTFGLVGRAVALPLLVLSALGLLPLIRSRPEVGRLLAVAACSFVLYYLLVACSLYGYNYWDGRTGTHNLGGRYLLFLVPLIVASLVAGLAGFVRSFPGLFGRAGRLCAALVLAACVSYAGASAYSVDVAGWVKDDMRELVSAWYDLGCGSGETVLHQWCDATFHYYLEHDSRCRTGGEPRVAAEGTWIRDADAAEMADRLRAEGRFDGSPFYYVAPAMGMFDSLDRFERAARENGYEASEFYRSPTGRNVILYVTPSGNGVPE